MASSARRSSRSAGVDRSQAAHGILVDGLAAAKAAEDLGLGATSDGVAVVVGEPDALDDGAVLVLANADVDVHIPTRYATTT